MTDVECPSAEEVGSLARRLRGESRSLKKRPVHDLLESLGSVGERFLDPADPLRREALARLPEAAGLSGAMALAVLDGMAKDWTRPRLRRLVESEFSSTEVLDQFVVDDGGRSSRAFGGDLTFQVVAGSVPGVGVNALLRSLLVKSPTLVKTGAGDEVLPVLFERALGESDAPLAASLGVRYWPGSNDSGQTAAALGVADVAVVYGGDRTVRAFRSLAPATTHVVSYRHREAVVLVGRDALNDETEAAGVAGAIARAVAMFEQRGCVCPHLVLVEEGDGLTPEGFARLLAGALSDLESELPSVFDHVQDSAAVQQLRGVAELQSVSSGGFVASGGETASWTVVFEPESMEGPPTLSRGVRVRPVEDLLKLDEALSSFGRHLQSVGVAGAGSRLTDIAGAVGVLGASRVVPINRLAFPPAWWLHDGRGPLRELVRWVEVEAD